MRANSVVLVGRVNAFMDSDSNRYISRAVRILNKEQNMEKTIEQMSEEELKELVSDVQEHLKAQGVKFKKTKFVRKKGPWR